MELDFPAVPLVPVPTAIVWRDCFVVETVARLGTGFDMK